ncbi:MAG: glycosyltransferase family 39 protein, partial [Jatrophihabitantaceae bacterium]
MLPNLRPAPRHLLLGAILLGSGLLSSWNIGYAGYSTFYSTAARSMSLSWRACAFGAFDPGAHMSLDKLAGFLIPQALAARVFGFHPWAIALPQVIEGLVTVLACYLIGRRWRGPAAGLLAAAAAATTPMLLSMFGHVMEDGLLTMSLALAFLCWQSAIRRHRWTSLLLCAFWVAIGFQAKMMQAWIILPGLAAGYLIGAPGPLRRRLVRGLLTGLVALGLSLSWMTAIQLVPAADRPYIDGSTNNNIYSMVFGFNGINRLLPNLVPGAIGDAVNSTRSPTPVTRATGRPLSVPMLPRELAVPPGKRAAKLVLPYYATQVGWLYPAALAGLLFQALGVARWWRRGRQRLTEAERARAGTATALGLWLVLAAGLLSVANVPHVAYLATIAVQVAVLAGLGLAEAAQRLSSGRRIARLALPSLVLAQACWVAVIIIVGRSGPRWLVPTVLMLAGALAL